MLVTGCGGAVPAAVPVSGVPTAPAPTPEEKKPSVAPAPPLSVEDVKLAVYREFVDVEIPRLRPQHLADSELAGMAGASLRGAFKKLLRAPEQLAQLSRAAYDKELEVDECAADSCPKQRALEAAEKRAADALSRRYESLEKSRFQVVEALQDELEKRPTVGVALVLARVEELDEPMSDMASHNMPAEAGENFGELSKDNAMRGSLSAVEAYRRAAQLAGGNARLAAWAHYGAATHLFAQAEGDDALAELQAAAGSAPAALEREIQLRIAMLHASGRDYQSASKALARAMKASATVVRDSDLSALMMLAEYRGGDLGQALRAAVRSLQTPPAAGVAGIRDALRITPYGRERIAVDCLELLGVAALDQSGATAETQALLLGQLAQRRFFRDDTKGAALAARAAVDAAPTAGEAQVAYQVLETLAKKAGRSEEAQQWKTKRASLRPAKVHSGAVGVLSLLGAASFEVKEHQYLEGSLESAGSTLQRRVASVVRLCLEPSFMRLANSDGLRVVTFRISVRPDGEAESLMDERDELSHLSDCLAEQTPHVFRGSKHSVNATLDLKHAEQTRFAAHISESMKNGSALDALVGSGPTRFGAGSLRPSEAEAGGGGTRAGVGGVVTRGAAAKRKPAKKTAKP
jgi:hypothetical protein